MDRLVAIAVERRYLMVGLLFAVLIGGAIAFKQLNIEAYPDPTPPMVDVVTQSPGLSAEEIERYITIPIETQVAGIKNLNTIRTVSLYGLSHDPHGVALRIVRRQAAVLVRLHL